MSVFRESDWAEGEWPVEQVPERGKSCCAEGSRWRRGGVAPEGSFTPELFCFTCSELLLTFTHPSELVASCGKLTLCGSFSLGLRGTLKVSGAVL